jgi:hypothetical protein
MKRFKRKTVDIIFGILLVVGILTADLGGYYAGNVGFIVGVVIMVCAPIFYFIFNRCPNCGKYLGRARGKYCQHCGEKLDE